MLYSSSTSRITGRTAADRAVMAVTRNRDDGAVRLAQEQRRALNPQDAPLIEAVLLDAVLVDDDVRADELAAEEVAPEPRRKCEPRLDQQQHGVHSQQPGDAEDRKAPPHARIVLRERQHSVLIMLRRCKEGR